MKNIMNERQQIYVNMMTQRLQQDLQDLDAVERNYVDEVIRAVALGCCLQKPRVFAGKTVTAQDFQQISRIMPYEVVCVCVQALAAKAKKGDLRNRVWYIMGTVVQILYVDKPTVRASGTSHQHTQNFTERRYTPEELKSIVTDIGTLCDDDLLCDNPQPVSDNPFDDIDFGNLFKKL